MTTYLVVTITCPDRPGVIEHITKALVGTSGNWEDSRMARLGGDFAGIIKISVADEDAESLADAIRALADDQMTVLVKMTREPASDVHQEHTLCRIQLSGADHEGIVHKVSAYLAGQGINVEAMETEIVRAPTTATPLFQMKAELKVPHNVSLAELDDSLRQVGDELGVDIEVQPGPAD